MEKNYTPYQVEQGRELQVKEEATGGIYAGSWPEKVISESDEVVLGTFDDPVRGEDEPAAIEKEEFKRNAAIMPNHRSFSQNLCVNITYQLMRTDAGVCCIDFCTDVVKSMAPDNREVVVIDPAETGVGLLDPSIEAKSIALVLVDILNISDIKDEKFEYIIDLIDEAMKSELQYTAHDIISQLLNQELDGSFNYKEIGELAKGLSDNYSFEHYVAPEEVKTNVGVNLLSGSDYSYHELISEDKIVIFDFNVVNKSIAEELVQYGIQLGQVENSQEDYFFVVNPGMFDNVDMGQLLSTSPRNHGYICTFLQSDIKNRLNEFDLFGNLFVFRINNKSTAAKIAQKFDIGANTIEGLDDDEFVGRLYTKNGRHTEPFVIQSFATLRPDR